MQLVAQKAKDMGRTPCHVFVLDLDVASLVKELLQARLQTHAEGVRQGLYGAIDKDHAIRGHPYLSHETEVLSNFGIEGPVDDDETWDPYQGDLVAFRHAVEELGRLDAKGGQFGTLHDDGSFSVFDACANSIAVFWPKAVWAIVFAVRRMPPWRNQSHALKNFDRTYKRMMFKSLSWFRKEGL
jgi:hypothetical protein